MAVKWMARVWETARATKWAFMVAYTWYEIDAAREAETEPWIGKALSSFSTHHFFIVYGAGARRCCWRGLLWGLFPLDCRVWLGDTELVDVHHVGRLHVNHQIPCALERVLAQDTEQHCRRRKVLSWGLCNTQGNVAWNSDDGELCFLCCPCRCCIMRWFQYIKGDTGAYVEHRAQKGYVIGSEIWWYTIARTVFKSVRPLTHS